MYYMFIDDMQVPIPPASMQTKIRNRNKVVSLIGQGDINILKRAGLTEIEFKIMLPNSKYAFDKALIYHPASYYLEKLESLKTGLNPFQFIMVRMKDDGSMLSMDNIKVSLEDYSINEDANEGYDMYANIVLKQYRDWGSKKLDVKTNSDGTKSATITQTRTAQAVSMPQSVIAKSGDTLQTICKKALGQVSTSYILGIKSLNKIAIPAVLAAGQIIKLKSKEQIENGTILS